MTSSRLPFVLVALQTIILAGLVQHGGTPLWLLLTGGVAIVVATVLFVIGARSKSKETVE